MSAGIEKTQIIEKIHTSVGQEFERPDIVHTNTQVSCGFALSQVTINVLGTRKTFEGYDHRGDWRAAFKSAYFRAIQFVHYSAVSE